MPKGKKPKSKEKLSAQKMRTDRNIINRRLKHLENHPNDLQIVQLLNNAKG